MALIKNIGIWLSQGLNLFLYIPNDGWGSPDEMLCSRAWRMRETLPHLHIWIDMVYFWDTDHCKECYEIELTRQQLAKEFRECQKSKMAA